MFRVNLKELMQLSKAEEGAQLRHKRIKCGKWSYLICFALQDGYLNIERARRTRNGCTASQASCRRRRSLPQTFSQTWLQSFSDASSQTSVGQTSTVPSQQDRACQTWQPRQAQAGVDTKDLNMAICRHQQTTIVHVGSTSCQTRHQQLEARGTQVELKLKARWTQTEPPPILSSIGCTQTLDLMLHRDSHTQTARPEDVEELLQPYEQVFQLLLGSLSCQSSLLLRGVESINQLVDFKHLELQRQRVEAEAQQRTQDTIRRQKLRQLQASRAHKWRKQLKLARLRIKVGTSAKLLQQQQQEQAPSNLVQTRCCSTQTKLEGHVASFAVAATQTDRVRGFSWLRHNN